MLVRYRGINNKGVLERPWTKWRVLRAISSTLKCQFTGKLFKVDFLMPCKTKSCHSSREKLRMLRALLPDTPRPPQFQPELQKNSFCVKLDFSRFTNRSLVLNPKGRQGPQGRHADLWQNLQRLAGSGVAVRKMCCGSGVQLCPMGQWGMYTLVGK